jgi:hypothetical protein
MSFYLRRLPIVTLFGEVRNNVLSLAGISMGQTDLYVVGLDHLAKIRAKHDQVVLSILVYLADHW